MGIIKKKEVYLDHAGCTPLDKKIARKIYSINKKVFHNPSAIHLGGVLARKAIERARGEIAQTIRAHGDEIIFTGSGTESDALAIFGVVNFFKRNNQNTVPHIITSTIEHPAVLENVRFLEKNNLAEVDYVQPDNNGIISSKRVQEKIKSNTILISIMYANNEIGTIQPIREIAKTIRFFKKNRKDQEGNSIYPLFHTDACQAVNYLDISNVERLGVDLMSFNGSKIYGPKGVGVLYKKRRINIEPLYLGGGQEFAIRSGTENASLIVGLSLALKKAEKDKKKESERLSKLRDCAIGYILDLSKDFSFEIILNGDPKDRLPNNINISIFGIPSEVLVLELSERRISVSEKSDCKSGNSGFSHVLKSIYGNKKELENIGSLRITLGRKTRKKDIKYLIKSLREILTKYEPWKD